MLNYVHVTKKTVHNLFKYLRRANHNEMII